MPRQSASQRGDCWNNQRGTYVFSLLVLHGGDLGEQVLNEGLLGELGLVVLVLLVAEWLVSKGVSLLLVGERLAALLNSGLHGQSV